MCHVYVTCHNSWSKFIRNKIYTKLKHVKGLTKNKIQITIDCIEYTSYILLGLLNSTDSAHVKPTPWFIWFITKWEAKHGRSNPIEKMRFST